MNTRFAPDTADGWAMLHQFFTVNWQGILELGQSERDDVLSESVEYFSTLESYSRERGQSACFHMLGHKGTLMCLHFRNTFEECGQVELDIARLPLAKYLTLVDSYVSVVELGMYHATKKIVESLTEKGIEPYSTEWMEVYEEKLAPHRENLNERRYTEIPLRKYVCFYPMNKARGEKNNWYTEDLAARARYMMEHGMTGRRFAGKVNQIISGSIGFDGWEWGVDLFSDDHEQIKKLVYEMRFDDATALFGEFGEFYFGTRVLAKDLGRYFHGELRVAC